MRPRVYICLEIKVGEVGQFMTISTRGVISELLPLSERVKGNLVKCREVKSTISSRLQRHSPTVYIRPFVSSELLDRLSEKGLVTLVLDHVALFLATWVFPWLYEAYVQCTGIYVMWLLGREETCLVLLNGDWM